MSDEWWKLSDQKKWTKQALILPSHKNFYTCEITILLLISLLKCYLFHCKWYSCSGLFGLRCKVNPRSYDLFGLRGKRGEVEGSRVQLVENMLILSYFYSTLFYSLFLSLNSNGPLCLISLNYYSIEFLGCLIDKERNNLVKNWNITSLYIKEINIYYYYYCCCCCC